MLIMQPGCKEKTDGGLTITPSQKVIVTLTYSSTHMWHYHLLEDILLHDVFRSGGSGRGR